MAPSTIVLDHIQCTHTVVTNTSALGQLILNQNALEWIPESSPASPDTTKPSTPIHIPYTHISAQGLEDVNPGKTSLLFIRSVPTIEDPSSPTLFWFFLTPETSLLCYTFICNQLKALPHTPETQDDIVAFRDSSEQDGYSNPPQHPPFSIVDKDGNPIYLEEEEEEEQEEDTDDHSEKEFEDPIEEDDGERKY